MGVAWVKFLNTLQTGAWRNAKQPENAAYYDIRLPEPPSPANIALFAPFEIIVTRQCPVYRQLKWPSFSCSKGLALQAHHQRTTHISIYTGDPSLFIESMYLS